MNAQYSLSLIIPLYNEIEILEPNLRQIVAFLQQHFRDYEVVIVESASTDGSAEACDRLAAELTGVKVIHESGKNGIGSATRIGFAHATKDLVWRYAIDLPCPLTAILDALPMFATHDGVVSYRSRDERTPFRRFQSFIYNSVVKLSLNITAKHVNSSFKVFRRDVIQRMPLRSNTGFVDAEMLYWAAKRNVSCVEIPVELTDRTGGRSSVTLLEPVDWLKELVRLKTRDVKAAS